MKTEKEIFEFADEQEKRHKSIISKFKKYMNDYSEDKKKIERRKHCLCKHCSYMNKYVVVQNAFVKTLCECCNTELIFANSDIDLYCEECAKKHNICKHCGSTMD